MRTIWHSLAWKEWHEHKWKLASLAAVLCGVTSIALWSGREPDYSLSIDMLALCVVPLSIFVGLGIAANERSRDTLPFLMALPVPMPRVAIIKVVLGGLTVAVSLLLAVVLLVAWSKTLDAQGIDHRRALAAAQGESPLQTGYWYLDASLFYVPVALSLFIWSAAIGVNRKDEIRAGALALAIMIGWATLMIIAASLADSSRGTVSIMHLIGVSTAPTGPALAEMRWQREYWAHWQLYLSVAVIVHALLIGWYIARFGRGGWESRSSRPATAPVGRGDWLAPPRFSPWTAVVWKQLRESGPIALVGIAGAVGITVATILVDWRLSSHLRTTELIADVYPRMAITFGTFIALVLGIAAALNDLNPRLNAFWRSRPIRPDLWFGCNFATGLVVLLSSIYAPIYLLALWGSPVWAGWSPTTQLVIPTMQIAVYAAAAAMTCLVRHAVYAAILSIAAVYLGVVATWAAGVVVRREFYNFSEMTEGEVIGAMVFVSVVGTAIAWLAMRYDWGWKSRY